MGRRRAEASAGIGVKRSARPATGTRGWTTLLLSSLLESVQTSVKSRGVPVLSALGEEVASRLSGLTAQAVPAARSHERIAGGTFSQSGSSIDASSYVPGCNFAPTVGFAARRSALPAEPRPGQRNDSTSRMFYICSALSTRFRTGGDHGMPARVRTWRNR